MMTAINNYFFCYIIVVVEKTTIILFSDYEPLLLSYLYLKFIIVIYNIQKKESARL